MGELIDFNKPEETEPKGDLVFRCERTAWVGEAGDINFRTRYRPLKNLSGNDERCAALWDDLYEFMSSHSYDHLSTDPVIHEGKHGKLYYVAITNESTDWETGYIDGYDLELKEYA